MNTLISALSQAPGAERVVGLVSGGILVLLARCGPVRRSVLVAPFFVTILADTPIPRSRALHRTFIGTGMLVLAGVLLLGGIVTAVRVVGGGTAVVDGIGSIAACVRSAVTGSVLRPVSQALGDRARIPASALTLAVVGSGPGVPALAATPRAGSGSSGAATPLRRRSRRPRCWWSRLSAWGSCRSG